MNLYEEEYWNITSNSTGVSYVLDRPVKPWNYTQCAIADSQFFWAGQFHVAVTPYNTTRIRKKIPVDSFVEQYLDLPRVAPLTVTPTMCYMLHDS